MVDYVKVSVIIPVYNAERYLEECLGSLINQTLQEIEIICVDDGSQDNSFNIIEQFKEKDARIVCIQQYNQYAGIARNNGLKVAKGKYVVFLDADDYFERDMLHTLFCAAEKKTAEVVVFGNYTYSEKENKIINSPFPKSWMLQPGLTSSKRLGNHIFSATRGVPWNKFILKEYLESHHILFQGLKHNNDEFFSKLLIVEANRILLLRKRFVYYRINNPKSLQGMASTDLNCIGEVYKALYVELKKRGEMTRVIEDALGKAFEGNIVYYLQRAKDAEEAKKFYDYLKNDVLNEIDVNLQKYEIIQLIRSSINYDEFVFSLHKYCYDNKRG